MFSLVLNSFLFLLLLLSCFSSAILHKNPLDLVVVVEVLLDFLVTDEGPADLFLLFDPHNFNLLPRLASLIVGSLAKVISDPSNSSAFEEELNNKEVAVFGSNVERRVLDGLRLLVGVLALPQQDPHLVQIALLTGLPNIYSYKYLRKKPSFVWGFFAIIIAFLFCEFIMSRRMSLSASHLSSKLHTLLWPL